jgi:N-acetylglutamate synthase-like GNAT family acetyltransferase
MVIRRATSDDLGRVASLVHAAGLQPLPAGLPLANILVALEDRGVIGVIALQVIGLRGLVWPAAVSSPEAGDGVRSSLLQTLLARAHELSLRELYLLTEKDAEFFAGTGFVEVSPDAVPAEIRATREYREQCTETAVLMRLQLASRFV